MTDKRKKIVAAFLLITAVGCFGIMGSILVSDGGNVGQYKTEKQSTKTTNKNKKKKWRNPINWEKIQRVNPEVYAWIKVPDTVIDYPVLQPKIMTMIIIFIIICKKNILSQDVYTAERTMLWILAMT